MNVSTWNPELDALLCDWSEEECEIFIFQLIPSHPTTHSNPREHTVTNNGSRFQKVSDSDVTKFMQDLQNADTMKKTKQDMSVFQSFLQEEGESRFPEVIPPHELNAYICSFLPAVRKKDDTEYEPTSLRCYFSSLDRYLKMKCYHVSISTDIQFMKAREVLKLKQKQLKGMGKGNKPRSVDSITDEQIEQLYQQNVAGCNNPSSLVHSL